MPMMARSTLLHDRPDIRLHPMSINATIVYFSADIREESIYAVLGAEHRLFTPPLEPEISNCPIGLRFDDWKC
jgi:hypothetical protein